jgi:hypothetical protein
MSAARRIRPDVTLNDRASAKLDSQITVGINKPVGCVHPGEATRFAARLIRPENLIGSAPHDLTRAPASPARPPDQDSHGLLILPRKTACR